MESFLILWGDGQPIDIYSKNRYLLVKLFMFQVLNGVLKCKRE